VGHRARSAGIGDGRDKQIENFVDRRHPGEVLAVRAEADIVAVGIVEEDLARDQLGFATIGANYARKRKGQTRCGAAFQENAAIN
jgi:hypothetical protein